MKSAGTTAVRIGLHELAGLRWPKAPLCGDGPRQPVAVPLPRLPWSTAAVEVPLGAGVAAAVARVTRLRKIFGFGIAPTIILLFIVADVLLIWARYGNLHPPGPLFAVLGLLGAVLILAGLLPDAVARTSGTPYVSRGQLRITKARAEVVAELCRLNPKAAIETDRPARAG